MLLAMPERAATAPAELVRGTELKLLNDYQRDFPLITRPFARIARAIGLDEHRVLDTLGEWVGNGTVSRVGPVFAPRRVGASTLAALKAPPRILDDIAEMVSVHPEVNHNYAREHEWNLWFVVTAPDAVAVARVLRQIRRDTECEVIALPLRSEYHIDLGFDLVHGRRTASRRHLGPVKPVEMTPLQSRLLGVLQTGLPLVSRPFARVAYRIDTSERAVLDQIKAWADEGVIKRFGVVVRHHELGYRANAMCVWNVPDAQVEALGARLARVEGVNLCYRRERAGAQWPFNLYCMLHGKDRNEVRARWAQLRWACALQDFDAEVLFSTKRFKQCGAHYAREAVNA